MNGAGLNVVGPEYSDLLTIDFARLLKTELGKYSSNLP